MGTGFFLAIRPIAPPTHRTRSRSQCSGSKTPSDNSFGYKFGLCVPPSYNLFPTLSRSAVAEGCDTHRNTSARCPEAQRRYHRESPLILFAILVWFQIAPFSRPECLDSANVRTNTLAYIPTLTSQFSALTVLFGLCAWFIGHQASHCAAYRSGQAELSYPLAFIMGLETFLGIIFLVWFAYRDSIAHAVGLLVLSVIMRIALVKLENIVGLTRRAWAIGLSGIVVVPALLIGLVGLVLHPISN